MPQRALRDSLLNKIEFLDIFEIYRVAQAWNKAYSVKYLTYIGEHYQIENGTAS